MVSSRTTTALAGIPLSLAGRFGSQFTSFAGRFTPRLLAGAARSHGPGDLRSLAAHYPGRPFWSRPVLVPFGRCGPATRGSLRSPLVLSRSRSLAALAVPRRSHWARLALSVVLWYYFDTLLFFLFFLFVPFAPFLLRGGSEPAHHPEVAECPVCGYRTADPDHVYCPRDGTRLDRRG